MVTGEIVIVSDGFAELARVFPARAAAVVGETALDLAGEIKANIVAVDAIDTGLMMNSTQAEHQPGSLEADVFTAAEYWKPVNYGTATTPGRPFVEPAEDTVRPRFEQRIAKAMEP